MDGKKKSVAGTIVFADFCDMLDDIRNNAKQTYKQTRLSEFIAEYRNKGKQLKKTDPDIETTFYPVLRLLLPQRERERSAYGLKEHAFSKSIVKVLALPPKGEDAIVLNKFASATTARDFADVAYNVLRKHFSGSKGLTIADVNDHLDSIAKRNSENDIRGQENEIFKLFKLTSPSEQRWIIRMILKQVTLGIGLNKILRLYHPDAVALFDSNNSLSKTCEILHDPSVRSNEIDISLFTPFRPMLSQRCNAKEFLKLFTENFVFFAETKFDGERFQVHMKEGGFKYFSRNGFDYTSNYGSDYTKGIFTPLLKSVFKPNVHSVILDGEMMGWNRATKTLGSKAMNFDVKKLTDSSVHQPCFCVFDIILLNDVVLTNKSLKVRMELLESVLSQVEGVITISQRTEVKKKQDVLDALNNSMDRDEEGIVFKNPSSRYIPNDRKSGWWKMKLEYFSNVMSDLDVIIMGAVYTKRKASDFIVGVAVPSKLGNPTKFLSFAKIGTGLNREEFSSISSKLEPYWNKRIDENYEKCGLYFGKEKPDLWVKPEHSCILLVRGSELLRLYGSNPDFKAKYTLRFPRILRIRFDKPYYDCLTSLELDELAVSTKKLYNRHLELTDVESENKKLRKRKAKFQADDDVSVEVSNNILRNGEFCVLTGTQEWKKSDVEKAIRENGGAVVKMEGQNTFCILIGEDHSRTKYYKGSVDIVRLSWLRKVLDDKKFRKCKPQDMVYVTSTTKERFMSEYDRYGDSYTEKATRDGLQFVFNNILKEKDYINPMVSEIDAFHEDINFPYQFGVFRNSLAYFDKYKVINDVESKTIFKSVLEELEFKFWGGTVSSYLSKEVDLVVIKADSELRTEELFNYLNKIHNKNAKIVTKDYINEKVLEYKSV